MKRQIEDNCLLHQHHFLIMYFLNTPIHSFIHIVCLLSLIIFIYIPTMKDFTILYLFPFLLHLFCCSLPFLPAFVN